MKTTKKILAVLLALVMAFGMIACGNNADDDIKYDANGNPDLTGKTLKIGYFGGMTDGDCLLQQEVIKLFIEKWNTEKTFFGATVEFVPYDNTNNGAQDTEMSIKCAQKLIGQDKVQIIIPAQLSNIIQATGEIINEAQILDIGLGLSPTWMQQGWDFVYRSALANDNQIPSLTATMKSLNQQKVAVLYQNTDNCLTFRDSFKEAAAKDGLEIVCEEMLAAAGGTGITGQVTAAINSNPDTIFVTAMGGSFGTVVKQLRQSGYKGTIYIGQNLTATEVDSIGAEEVNGVIMCSPYVTYTSVEECTNAFLRPIFDEFYAKYSYCPVSDMLYKTWDAMLLVENAVLAAKSIDPVKMQAAIKTLKFEGCAGTMDFTTGSNECYFGARAWVYTGQGAAGAPVVLEDWMGTELAEKIVITNAK